MEFSRQEYWSGLPFPSPGDLPNLGIWPWSPAGRHFTIWATRESLKSESCSVMLDSLWPHGLYSPWNSPGQNTGAGSSSLLQGIFPIQGLNPGLPHCRQILYQLSHGYTLNSVITSNFNSSIFLISGILPSDHNYFCFIPSSTPTPKILWPLLGTSNSLILPTFHCISLSWNPFFLTSLKLVVTHYNHLLHKASTLLHPLVLLYS